MTAATGSRKVATVAIKMALSESREDEKELKQFYLSQGIRTAAVDYGGEFLHCVSKIIERAVVAAKREGVIHDSHTEEGAIAGATHEALIQIMPKALGLNIGGKIGIARQNDHVSVAVFFGIGMIHLDEVTVALAHRAVQG